MNTLGLLRAKAMRRHGENITPCDGKTWDECITNVGPCAMLWYNTSDHSTHIVKNEDFGIEFISAQFGMLDIAVVNGLMSKNSARQLKDKIFHLWDMSEKE